MQIPSPFLAAEGGASLHLLPDPATLVQSAILFSILAVVLWKFAWPSILHALEERERHIRSEIDRAEKNRAESERLIAEYQARLEAARADAQKIIDEGKADATRLRDQILKEAREEGTRLTAQARREIELAEDKALHELHERAVALSIGVAERILERTLRPEDHRDAVERFVQEAERELARKD